jgi:nucleotidyltransferase/DNA polymerase involved in DNA repair
MSFVCLWSPTWPTGAAFPADLGAALLAGAPRIAIGEAGRVWADARGLSGSALAETLLAVAREHGVADVRAGVAMSAVAAEVAAVYGEGPRSKVLGPSEERSLGPRTLDLGPPLVVRPGSDREFLSGFPISVLSPPEELVPLLDGIGIETCHDLARLDAESVEVRLGADGVRLWRLARADDARWLFHTSPRALPSASLDWVEYTLADPERLLFIINALAGSVCTELVARGERAREVSLVFSLANRRQSVHAIRTARPSADRARWMRLIRGALERLTLSDAVTGVALRVERVTGNDGAQGDLFDRGFASAGAVEDSLAQLVDDQGDDVLVSPQNSAHQLLEVRTKWVAEEQVRGSRFERALSLEPRTSQPALVLQLLTPPRPIAVTTEQRRDHEIPVRYRDGGTLHDLVEAAGPDRVSGGQWDVPYAREYYRCVRGDGLLVWLFRDAAQVDAGWYLHGWWD